MTNMKKEIERKAHDERVVGEIHKMINKETKEEGMKRVNSERKIGTSNGYMKRQIPEVSASHEKKVMKSIAKTGHYEMPEKRKKELSDAWEKEKPGTGFKK